MSEIGTVKVNLKNKDQLFSLWKSVKEVIEKGVPNTEAECAFLMEVMTDVSAANHVGHEYHLELPEEKATACWHCLNVAVNNKFFNNRGQESIAMETLSNFAESLDEYLQTKNAPENPQPEPQQPQSNVLPLVKSSTEKAHHNQ